MKPTKASSPHRAASASDEERRGLLSGTDTEQNDYIPPQSKATRRRITIGAVTIIVLLLGAVAGPALYSAVVPSRKHHEDFDNSRLRSNGTHYFKKTALIVSIDGLR